jgi:hypothetical protein
MACELKQTDQRIKVDPWVGVSIANDLLNIGITSVANLKGKDRGFIIKSICRNYSGSLTVIRFSMCCIAQLKN